MFEIAVAYLVAINGLTYAAFALDKRAAERRAWRVPERRLLMLAAFGGTPAAMAAQQILRHKTRKEPFRTSLWAIFAVQGALLAFAAYRLAR
ncbi:DUF1294 domain-containing protein [Phenylobacterium sp.]|uniref:DUF1294 domain-containing protein n=1 Tax=Phenylobacterium sp. TaxID=1871053 RepID=UPI0025E693A9|nr:DUF1294 domain-containing protein [Phenylobacterium sp.]MBX3485399.1 DUF1294 domain-containing protein [Phenylobacterium sp.]MCW5758392.1 DUF1294 domain-containing protein [Phenylobacterium sp.]